MFLISDKMTERLFTLRYKTSMDVIEGLSRGYTAGFMIPWTNFSHKTF